MKNNYEQSERIKELSIQKQIDKSNLNYYMSLVGLYILLAWGVYMLINLCSMLNFGNISPEVYTLLKHAAIILVGLILVLKGTSRLQRN